MTDDGRTATIVIGHWSSTCSACGRGASYKEDAHITQLGYGEHPPDGCGARFTAIRPEYTGDGEAEAVQRCRPDLPLEPAGFGFSMPGAAS